MAKYYVTIDKEKNVTRAFSDKFEKPQPTDICVNGNGGRHWHINIFTDDGYYKYKCESNKIMEKSHNEIYTSEIKAKILQNARDAKIKTVKQEMLERLLTDDISTVKTEYTNKKQAIDNAVTVEEINNL